MGERRSKRSTRERFIDGADTNLRSVNVREMVEFLERRGSYQPSLLEDGAWTNRLARGYRTRVPLRDSFQLRMNAYRGLLTRARDGVVVFVPEIADLDETAAFFQQSGFQLL